MNISRNDLDDTICAPATPEGVGALSVIRVSGKKSIEIVNQCFKGKNLLEVPSHTVHLGKFSDTSVIDELLATVFIAPRSFTGEDTIELSCHGSPYITKRILETLIQKGCRMAQAGEFTLRAFLNKKLDLTQAEAVADLIASTSAEGHRTAIQQLRGGFSTQLSVLKEKLINFASLIELELDFSEEDVTFADRGEMSALVQQLLDIINPLLDSFKYGNAIRNGIPTVIAGKPNAGKSTLLNALINEERAIVSSIAGTTRDTIEEQFIIRGIPFRLVDTAGIRKENEASDQIEVIGIQRTFEKIQQSSIVLYVFDSSTTSTETLQQELAAFEPYNTVVIPIANKIDLLNDASLLTAFGSDAIGISSIKKDGLQQLKERLLKVVEKDRVKNDVIITNLRHYESLQGAQTSLDSVLEYLQTEVSSEFLAFDVRKAIHHLGEITGDITTDDLLANIFSKFCIGK